MSIERRIIEKLNESRRIDEAFPPILNKLSRYERDKVRKALTKEGIDIENTPYNLIAITNGRDPRLKGKNVVVFEIIGREPQIAVWFNGEFLADPYIYYKNSNISKLSWKTILGITTRIFSMEFDKSSAQALKQKQADRKEAQRGLVQRYNIKNKPRYVQIDKSGYVVNPDKYKNMLAKMKINDGPNVLKQAREIYTKLAQNIDKIDWSQDTGYHNYDNIMTGILREFQDLTRSLNEFEQYKKNPIDKDDEERWWGKNLENKVANSIKRMRDILNKAKKYI